MNMIIHTRHTIYKGYESIGWVFETETGGGDLYITAYIGLNEHGDVYIKPDSFNSLKIITDSLGMEIRADGDNV